MTPENKKNKTFTVMLMSALMLVLGQASAETLREKHIEDQIKPFFAVYLDGQQPQPAAEGGLTPEQYYEKYCVLCHKAGVSGAPIVGKASDWKPRIAQGMDTLVGHAINGLNAMPPKGTCMACSDEDIAAIVEYMVEESK